ncbi:MAG: aspartate/glutamate racemase family protein [Pseudomonadota bacterium]
MIGPVLLINPNGNAKTTRAMARIARKAAPGLRLEGVTTKGGPKVITTPGELDRAANAVAARQIPARFVGVIVAAFGDPGRDALADRLDMPVIGIAEAGMSAAAAGGRRFSVATTTPDLADRIRGCAERYGHARQLVSIRLTEGDPLVVMEDPKRLRDAMRKTVNLCAADGADVVVIGGGPLARVARDLQDESPVPLIEPVPEAARLVVKVLQSATA